MSRCPGHGRHWFAVHGAVGMRSPVCVRCGIPNPRPLSADELAEYEHHVALLRRLRERVVVPGPQRTREDA